MLTEISTKVYIFLFYSCFYLCNGKKYHNFTLYRGTPVTEEHLSFFQNISKFYEVNFWRPPSLLYKPVDFVISPEDKLEFLKESVLRRLYLTTLNSNVQRAFDKQRVHTYIRRNLGSFNWQSYFRLDDIYSWLRDMQRTYPREMTLQSIGETAEKREILAVIITLKGCEMRSKVIVEGGIHAREWISPAFVTYMIQQILESSKSKNDNLKKIAKTYQWIIMPVVNPDGYEYSHTNDRLWRKNRSKPNGVDINRNFDLAFGKVGVSYDQSEDTYCGPNAFSEKESSAMAQFIRKNSDNLEYYIGFHSYGQFMILPYAHLTQHMANYDTVHDLGLKAAQSIYKRYKTSYEVGTAYDTVGYRTSGVSGCWVKHNFQVPYVVTFELRDSGEDGFALRTEDIIPTCKETMDGLLVLLTPQTRRFEKKTLDLTTIDGQIKMYPDIIVTLCNVILFIIVRFY